MNPSDSSNLTILAELLRDVAFALSIIALATAIAEVGDDIEQRMMLTNSLSSLIADKTQSGRSNSGQYPSCF